MTHLTYLSIILATISNALLMSICMLNNPVYHTFEIATVLFYILFGILVSKLNQWLNWLIVAVLLRFSLYSAIWGYVAYKNWLYLGDTSITDRFTKWLLYDVTNQGVDALAWMYIVGFICSVLLYLRIYFNEKS